MFFNINYYQYSLRPLVPPFYSFEKFFRDISRSKLLGKNFSIRECLQIIPVHHMASHSFPILSFSINIIPFIEHR